MTSSRLSAVAVVALATPSLAHADADTEATAPAVTESAPPTTPKREPTGYFAVGAAWNPDENFVGRAEITQPDLFRTGQRLSLSAEMSAVRQHAAMTYEVPDLLGSGLDMKAEVFTTRRQLPAFARDSAGGALTLGKRISRSTRVYVRYGLEHVDIETQKMPVRPDTPLVEPNRGPLGDGKLATLGAGLEYNTLDMPYLPTRGTRFAIYGERADRRLGSDHDLARVQASLDHATPVGPFTLRLHGHAGLVRSRDGAVPLAHRLMHDGHGEVRGYALDEGNLTGDNIEAVGRAELEVPVWRRAGLSLAGWVDAGIRRNTDMMWGPASELVQRSAGVGIIWRSPIGPMRFDIAYPLDGADRPPQFLFSLGGSF